MRKILAIPVLCGSLLLAPPGFSDDIATFEPIPQQTLLDYLAGKTQFTLLDARSAQEYEAGHIWGAASVPHDSDLASSAALPADHAAPIVVYCKSGQRAQSLQQSLLAMGYTDVRVLGPAQMLWADELPVFNCGASAATSTTLQTAPSAQGGKS